jgi:UDP-glucose 4-epimerase
MFVIVLPVAAITGPAELTISMTMPTSRVRTVSTVNVVAAAGEEVSSAIIPVAVAASRNLSETTVCLTRYGNVMASRGSVIPLFLKQIQEGNPITITDPNMTRFLMSLDEAVELVLFAFEHGNPGDLFVNKAPAGTIGDLAQALKELCQADTEIKIIGTRHGEKLYETLCTREEMMKAEDMGDFYRIAADNRDLNYAKYFSEGEEEIATVEDYHSHNTIQLGVEGMKTLLSTLPLIRKEVFGEEITQILG